MDLQKLIDKAREAKGNGALRAALNYYNKAFDLLIREAAEYARNQKGTYIDDGEARKIMPKFSGESKNYLKRDKTAAVISNNMGVIFAELGDYEGAKEFFKQAIELTPDGNDYLDPKINLNNIK